jgi:hypothetical protein
MQFGRRLDAPVYRQLDATHGEQLPGPVALAPRATVFIGEGEDHGAGPERRDQVQDYA